MSGAGSSVKPARWNIKAILRVMRKLSLPSVIRRRRPYIRYKQAVHKYPNLPNRRFKQLKPNRFWATDITYIPISGRMFYMCAVLNLYGKVVLAWKIGSICPLLWLQTPSVKGNFIILETNRRCG